MTDQFVAQNAAMAAAATAEVEAVKPPIGTPFPVATLRGHPWEPAVVAGRAFVAELAKVGKEGRGWVLAEVGIAGHSPAAFVLGLGVGAAGAVVGALLVRAFGV